MNFKYILFFIFIFLGSFFLTGILRRYALSRKMMDIPNERSSHGVPTPRGGGMGIVLAVLAGLIVLKIAGLVPVSFFVALLGSGAWVAMVGWLDDRQGLPAIIRLIGHFIGAGWALLWLSGLPPLMVFGQIVDLGWIGSVLAAFYLVWLLNLYNFMDGIDGIAGIEAITVCVGGVVLWAISSAGEILWMTPVLVVAAAVGFLFWNFPRAMVFMGDAGSGFLGLVMGVLSIQAGWAAPELFWGWLILLGAFVVDATVTLLCRAWRGEKVYEAHRSHAYQHAARRLGGHPQVSLAFGVINLFWLFPVAVLVTAGLVDGMLGVFIAYMPLVGAAVWFQAGKTDGD